MKKKTVFLASIVALSMVLSGCGNNSKPKPNSSESTSSSSSSQYDERYEIYLLAVEAGYTGTYEEWLESIKGKDGCSILTGHGLPKSTLGNEGDTYIDLDTWDFFVKEDGMWMRKGNIKGADGKDGVDGQDGQDGKDGEDGKDGQDGVTPHIGENGNWWIGDQDTGIPATGADGTDGKDGENGTTPHIGENGHWWIGDTDTGIPATGVDGEDGEDGKDGQDGTSLLTGNGEPSSNLGIDGDSYVDLDTWNYYVKENGIWVLKGNIKGQDAANIDKTYNVTFYMGTESEFHSGKSAWHVIRELNDIPYLSKISRPVESDFNLPNGYRLDSGHKNEYVIVDDNNLFDGYWSFSNSLVTSDVSIFVYGEKISYSVQFLNNDGAILYQTTAHYGDTVTYPYTDPIANDQQAHYIYTFTNWDKELVVYDDVTFVAQYHMQYSPYTAKYYDENDNLLYETLVSEGETPSYVGDEPTKASTTNTQYQFNGWNLISSDNDTFIYKPHFESCTNGLIFENNSVYQYVGSSKTVTIPAKWDGININDISERAFEGTSVKEVSIPDSVATIGSYAFYDCDSLTTINIPSSVTKIKDSAFFCCTSLASIALPNSVTSIGNGAFSSCTSLTSITIPEYITSIGDSTFDGCTALIEATIPNSVYSINQSAFRDCFSLTSIVIPESVASIGSDAFANCLSLASVVIGNNVTRIDSFAFYYCGSLTSIIIPKSVVSMSNSVFEGCSSLTIYCENEYKPKQWDANWNSSKCAVIWGFDGNTYSTSSFEYVLSSGFAVITGIKNGINNVSIPETIDGYQVSYLTYSALANSQAYINKTLVSFSIPESVEILGGFPTFVNFSALTSVIVPNGVTSIKPAAFGGCSSLTSVVIPEGVTSIGGEAFYNCSSLTSITLPNSVTTIDTYAFYGLLSLTSIVIPESVTSMAPYVFYGCPIITIYCEAESQPSGWDSRWNDTSSTPIWGYKVNP